MSELLGKIRERAGKKPDLKFICVHGLCGWGSYDLFNKAVPYWGFFEGNIVKYLCEQGYDCYSASVDPYGSAWDRACELYAQLAGTVVDYGVEHSSRSKHGRFGKDYSKDPLIKDFKHSKIVLIGHSFGGATVRLFSELLINGSETERKATKAKDLSDFFKGGHKDTIFSIVTLAAPTNGTTAYNLYDDLMYDFKDVDVPEEYHGKNLLFEGMDLRDKTLKSEWDTADYDMHIDNALELNSRISTFEDIYYFSYPCCSTFTDENGHCLPDTRVTTAFFLLPAYYMSNYSGVTKGGVVIDDSWHPNDGLVNVVSARAPFGEPAVDFEEGMTIKTGIWHVMPTVTGDHMHLMGGTRKPVNVKPFFVDLLDMIIALE